MAAILREAAPAIAPQGREWYVGVSAALLKTANIGIIGGLREIIRESLRG